MSNPLWKIFSKLLVVGFIVCLTNCGSTAAVSGGSEDEEETEGSSEETSGDTGGTVTISGTLQYVSGDINLLPKSTPVKATIAESYKALIINTSTGGQAISSLDSSGTFTFTASSNSSYMVNFLNDDYNYVGTLATDSVGDDDTVPVAFATGEDTTTTSLGTVTANTTTGQVVSDATLDADTTHKAAASSGIIAGGNTGEGDTNYDSTTVTDEIADATDPDDDNDGVPDVFDTDNNNNGYSDEADGVTDSCIPGDVKLYIENYTTAGAAAQQGFPTPAEVDDDLPSMTQYQIHLEFTPGDDYPIDDISEISVSTPDYIGDYGYVYDNFTNASSCFNTLWESCNNKKLVLSNDGAKYVMAIADKNVGVSAGILEGMSLGDTFILNISMADGTEYTCSKKINIIPKHYPYAVKLNGNTINTGLEIQTSLSDPFTFSWSIPTQSPSGLTYELRVIPYSACGVWNPDVYTTITAGQDAVSKQIAVSELPTSGINIWSVALYATDGVGDESYTTQVQLTTAATDPCP